MDNDFATGYALGADSSNNNNCCNNGGFWGDNGWWTLILFAMIFGYGNFGGGWGGFGGGGSAGAQGAITRSNLWSEFAFNDLQRNVQGIQQGLCDGFYAVNSTLLNGFNGVQAGQAQLANQIANCCCDTGRQIEKGFCDVGYNMATNTSNIIQSQHNDTDRVIAKLNDMEAARQQEKIASLQAENQSLKFAASQSNQNAYLTATMDANVAELIRRINPTPVPAYTVPAPYPYSGCGTYNYSGCGCNSCC